MLTNRLDHTIRQSYLMVLVFAVTALCFIGERRTQATTPESSPAPIILTKSQLTPPLRTPLKELRFSPDGKYILVQDDSMIYLLTRDPFTVRFTIVAHDALPARFSSDSHLLLIPTLEGVEGRDLTDDQIKFKNLVSPQSPCYVAELSPDGEIYACIDKNLRVRLFRTLTGEQIYSFTYVRDVHLEKSGRALNWSLHSFPNPLGPTVEFSGDSKFLFIGMRLHPVVAILLPSKNLFPIARQLQDGLATGTLAFIGPSTAVYSDRRDLSELTIVSFPEGRSLKRLPLAGRPVATRNPNCFLLYSQESAEIRVVDVQTATAKMTLSAERADVSPQGVVAAYTGDGKMALSTLDGSSKTAETELPAGLLPEMRTVRARNDLQSIALSAPEDSGLYDVRTGTRLFHLSAFGGIWYQNDQNCYLLSATRDNTKMKRLELGSGEVDVAWQRAESWSYQFAAPPEAELSGSALTGPVVLHSGMSRRCETHRCDVFLDRLRIEARDAIDGNLLWRRDYYDTNPTLFTNSSAGRLVLSWGGKQAKYKQPTSKFLRETTYKPNQLQLSPQDAYFEVLDTKTGKTIGGVIDPQGGSPRQVMGVFSAGDWVAVEEEGAHIIVFALSNGKEVVRSPAKHAAISGGKGMLVLSNDDRHLRFYDLATGLEVSDISFPDIIVYMQFSTEGSRLLVLTEHQTVCILDVSKVTATPPSGKDE